MSIERSDLSEDQWRFSGGERVSPDDPIVHGLRWRRERDEAREVLRELSEKWSDVRVSGNAARVAALGDAVRRARDLTDSDASPRKDQT